MERFACPTPDLMGRYRCIDDHVLCDGFIDCPGGEDEDGQACMFYKTVQFFFDIQIKIILVPSSLEGITAVGLPKLNAAMAMGKNNNF